MFQKRYLVFMQVAAAFLLAVLGLVASVLAAQAAPAAPTDVPVTQPDGAQLVLHIWGDEFSNGMETVDGYSVVQDARGYWVYAALQADGKLGPAQVNGKALVAGKDSPAALEKYIRPERSVRPQAGANGAAASGEVIAQNTPMTGSQPMLVILVKFANKENTFTPGDFKSRFFGASGSVAAFYKAASLNQLTLTPAAENDSTAYGGTANDGVIGWLTLPYNQPPNTDDEYYNKAPMIVKDALTAASNSGAVNFATFDKNSDNYISNSELHIVVITAGYEQSYCGNICAGPAMWGHRWVLNNGYTYSYDVVLNGKHLGQSQVKGGYLIFGEVMGYGDANDHQSTMGVMAHETGHDLNWPDEYDAYPTTGIYGKARDWEGTGNWSVMGGGSWNGGPYGGESPAMPDAFLRSYQGWITPTQAVTGSSYTLGYNYTTNTASVLRLGNNPNGVDWDFGVNIGTGEYWLVENRQKEGFDSALPNCGILIWHVNETRSYINSLANDLPATALIALEEADGLKQLQSPGNRGDLGDSYPGSTNNLAFGVSTNPNSSYQNSGTSGHNVTLTTTSCNASMSVSYTYSTPVLDKFIYLPKISNEKYSTPFTGRVTDNGAPVAGATLLLRYTTDDTYYTTYATTTTQADGTYVFNDTPEVSGSLKHFYVRYGPNTTNLSRLFNFNCNEVTSTNLDYTCDINLQDVALGSPGNGATVSNPVSFTWIRRSTASDSYEFNLFDSDGYYLGGYGPMGYLNTIRLNFNGGGLYNYTWYNWNVNVYTPDGYGVCQGYRSLQFNNVTYTLPNSAGGLFSPFIPSSAQRPERDPIYNKK